jgi:hypothetical protein
MWLGVWCMSLAEAMLRTSHKCAIMAFSPLQFNFGGGQCCGWRLLSRKTAIIQEHMSQAAMGISNAEAKKKQSLGQCAAHAFCSRPIHSLEAIPRCYNPNPNPSEPLPPPFLPSSLPTLNHIPTVRYFFFSCPRLNKYQVRPADLLPIQHN